jgi:putative ATP-dependent endonuclease of the OLD family
MCLKAIRVQNFRLLHDAELLLEDCTTVIVGRNNSGKTSLTEVVRRFLEERPTFTLEDFSFACHQGFWNAYAAHTSGEEDASVRSKLPKIEARFTFEYAAGGGELGPLSEFVIDLDPACTDAVVVARFALAEGRAASLFAQVAPLKTGMTQEEEAAAKAALFQALKETLPKHFECTFWAEDPNDAQNTKSVEGRALRTACASGFISAQRGLDDASQKERVVIGKVLESLFNTAKVNQDDSDSHATAEQLERAVQDIQTKIGADFNRKLDELLPALALFGYPGLGNHPKLRTETTLDVNRLLINHTKVRYAGDNGIHLPEAYNGLGTRNIILILLQLREFFKLFMALKPRPCTHLVFIEEPEVHLHPQMQEVFIRKLADIAGAFSKELGVDWPVQFVVSTHSAHVANEARFECVRYFMCSPAGAGAAAHTKIKDLRKGLSGKPQDHEFLHQYLTLTRCDLFFADNAILIEGTTERLLLPRVIEQFDQGKPTAQQLSSRYLSIVEVGGAYAHKFFDLLEFLELKTLIITDIDTVKPNVAKKLEACPVYEGTATSNACIKEWFKGKPTDPAALLGALEADKISGHRRIAYQVPEKDKEPCGRSFEDALMLANQKLFSNAGTSADQKAKNAWEDAKSVKKSEFALDHAIQIKDWITPRYITEGLQWLALDGAAAAVNPTAIPSPIATTAPALASKQVAAAASPTAPATTAGDIQ